MANERIIVGKYVDLMVDVAFKRVFGQPANKDLLIALLSAIIPELKIDDVTYLDKERNGSAEGDKKSVFDILCDTDKGEKVLIEMQLKPQDYFRDRTLYYASQEILYEHREGDLIYTLSSMYVISFLDFEMKHDQTLWQGGKLPARENGNGNPAKDNTSQESGKYNPAKYNPAKGAKEDDAGRTSLSDKFVWRYSLLERETGEQMTNALNFTFVELSKFNKTESELATLEDCFYFCLKQMGKLSKRPDNLDAAVFRKLFEVAEFSALPREQQKHYIAKMTTERDIRNQIAYARREGLEEGKVKGLKEGEAKGKAEGKAEERNLVAKALKSNGVSSEIISKCTGLSLEEIENL